MTPSHPDISGTPAPSGPTPGLGGAAGGDAAPVIRLAGIHKAFGSTVVLAGLDLEIRKGEVVSIVGPSGCGKSVTLKVIIRLLQPDQGKVEVLGRDVLSLDSAELSRFRRRVGMVFQFGALFDSLTVEENVAFGLERHTDMPREQRQEIVVEKLRAVGLRNILDKMPSELSGGMRKRVALARAITMEPEILLWDEPTTGLDPVMTSEIDRLVLEMRDRLGVTSLVVTHDMNSAFRISDRMGVHYEGRLVETGTPEAIRQSDDPFVHQFLHGLLEGPMKVRST